MSDALKHECGIGHIRLLKPLEFYKKKYGSAFYGINKMYLLMEKQHNRGQDGAGFASIKLDVEPGNRFISRIRSKEKQPIQDVFSKINLRINSEIDSNKNIIHDIRKLKTKDPYSLKNHLGDEPRHFASDNSCCDCFNRFSYVFRDRSCFASCKPVTCTRSSKKNTKSAWSQKIRKIASSTWKDFNCSNNC